MSIHPRLRTLFNMCPETHTPSSYVDALQPGWTHSLSVVIIARNEEKNIARTVESVLRALESQPGAEILLVDSASTDATVEIARKYPIGIVRLKPDWFLSAAAGRHIGTLHTHGDFIQFLDGDMELDPEWLDHALPYFADHPEAAVVGGYLRDIYINHPSIVGEDRVSERKMSVAEVNYIGGAMLCRRSALIRSGGFQPYIRSDEEVDFCLRIRSIGNTVVRMPYLICLHYCTPVRTFSGSIRRHNMSLWLGYGQLPRYYFGTPLFWPYVLQRYKFVLNVLILISFFLALLIPLLLNKPTITYILFGILFLSGGFLTFKTGYLRRILLSIFTSVLIFYNAARGFHLEPRRKEDYPQNPLVIQSVNFISQEQASKNEI